MKMIGAHLLLCLSITTTTTTTTHAFAPRTSPVFGHRTAVDNAAASKSTSALFISSWGTKSAAAAAETEGTTSQRNNNPEANIQSYLKAPEPVEARANLDGTVLVSGLVQSSERTDQFVFDLLNHEDSAFEFDKIIAFCKDVGVAKKRLLSRSARYTGLLDKLDFSEAAGDVPTSEQLEGVKSWVAYLAADEGDSFDLAASVKEIVAAASGASSLENVAILVTGASAIDKTAAEAATKALEGIKSTKKYSLVATGKLEDHPEGKIPYAFADFCSEEGRLADDAIFSRDEAMRMVTECLQLESGIHKIVSVSEVYDVNATSTKLIKGLRQAGYARPQEIDHVLNDGPENYQKAIDEFLEKNPNYRDGYYTTDIWWEDEAFKESVRKAEMKEGQHTDGASNDEDDDDDLDPRTEAVELIAVEWIKREYYQRSMSGEISKDMEEYDFAESVWDQAMAEAEIKYRETHGEDGGDGESELADFQVQQARKKETMLQRAKDEMKEVLDAENLGGSDLEENLASLKVENDDDREEDED